MKIYLLLFFAILILDNCAGRRFTTVKPPLKEDFYYDSTNYALIKLYPQKNKDVIRDYLNWVSEDSNSSWNFYKKFILNTKKNNTSYSKDDYDKIIIPKLIKSPKPDYPLDAPILGGFLTVVVTVTVDTNGYPEFVELYNIYRDDSVNSEEDKNLSEKNIRPWRRTYIDKYDIPFIKLSLNSTLETIFKPAELYSKRLRVKTNLPYKYIFSPEYDKRKKP